MSQRGGLFFVIGFPRGIMDQLHGKTCKEYIAALVRDGWTDEKKTGAVRCFYKDVGFPERRMVRVHYHPKRHMGKKELFRFLGSVGWSDADLRRLKLIK